MMQMQHNAAALALSKVENFHLKNIAAGFFFSGISHKDQLKCVTLLQKHRRICDFCGITSGNTSAEHEPLTSLSDEILQKKKIQDNLEG